LGPGVAGNRCARLFSFTATFFLVMANIVEIGNFALGHVAEQRINTLDDTTEPARLVKLHVFQVIRELLRSGKWKCARTPAELGRLTAAPLFGWQYAYQLPADFIRMVTLNDVDPDDVKEPTFEIQGTTILTDEAEANLVYIRDLTVASGDVNAMDPLLTKAVVLELAARLAWPLQQSRTLKESLEESAERALRKALAADAQGERRTPINQQRESNWATCRLFSTNG
jgi:hypothetical protein